MNKLRRRLLQVGATSAVATTTPWLLPKKAYAAEYTNEPGADSVVLGFTVPQSGPYSDEGADELRAFELAVEHLNGGGGMLGTMQPSSLQGNGILGRTVEYLVGDTQTKPDVARASATRLIDEEGAVMIAGGSSSGVAIAMQQVCQEKGVVFMAGLTHANGTTGEAGVKNGFRHFINAYMSDNALANHLTREYSGSRKVYYLTADYSWGADNEAGFTQAFESKGWETVAQVKTPLAQTDFTEYLTPVIESGADTLVLSLYGANLVNALKAVTELGLKDLTPNGNEFVIAAPLISEIMARGADEDLKGVYGSANWHWSLPSAGSRAFTEAYGEKYGFPPSAAAHTCYVQTLQYADACERAGTFDPCAVIAELQGHKFDGTGNGVSEYRKSDHQCFKDVVIVKGKDNPSSQFDLLEVVDEIPVEQISYATNNPLFGTNHGQCFNGVTSQSVDGTSSGSLAENAESSSSNETSSSGGGTASLLALAALSAAYAAKGS